MTVSEIFDEFDALRRASMDEHTKAVVDKGERRQLVVSLMKHVVKPFADAVIADAQNRDIAVSVDDRGNDEHRPSYTIQFDSYENKRTINGDRPSIKVTATADYMRVEVAEEMGGLEDPLDRKHIGAYNVEIGEPETLEKMTAALKKWLRHTLGLIVARK